MNTAITVLVLVIMVFGLIGMILCVTWYAIDNYMEFPFFKAFYDPWTDTNLKWLIIALDQNYVKPIPITNGGMIDISQSPYQIFNGMKILETGTLLVGAYKGYRCSYQTYKQLKRSYLAFVEREKIKVEHAAKPTQEITDNLIQIR